MLNANVTLHAPSHSEDDSDSDSEESYYSGPQFLTHAETFNAPLNLAIAHALESPPANVRVRAVNNLGRTRVSLDSQYAGTFDVSTMFAQADVLTWDGIDFQEHVDDDDDGEDDGEDDGSDENENGKLKSLTNSTSTATEDDDGESNLENAKVRLFLPSVKTTTTTSTASASDEAATTAGRCLEYDLISSSEIRGWVGIPPRPPPVSFREYGNQSHVEVISSLNGAQLILQP